MSTTARLPATVVLFGKWGPPFLTFARRAAAKGCRVYLLEVADAAPAWWKYSRHLSGGAAFDPRLVGTDEGMAELRKYAESVGADAVVPMSEAHLLWLAGKRGALEPDFRLCASPLRTLERLAGKKEQTELAAESGFAVLPTWVLATPADVESVPASAYPVALRPDRPYACRPELKVERFASAEALRRFVAGLPALEQPLVVQPFRAWPNLLVHGVRAEDGRVLALRAFLVYRKFEGVALSLCEAELTPDLEQACRTFVDAAGVVGCFHYDLLYSPEERQAYFLEINPRLGGTTEKVARFGYDEPVLTLAAFGFPVAVDPPAPARRRPVANRRALVKHMLHALRGRLSELDYPAAGRLRQFGRSCLEWFTTHDSVFDWRDLRGSLWFYLRV